MNKTEQKYWFFTGLFLTFGIAFIISYFKGCNGYYLYGGIVLFILGIARIYLNKFYKPFPYKK